MDKTERFIRDELSKGETNLPLDMDALIAGTHTSIKRRATRRKVIYASPALVILLILGLTFFPIGDGGSVLPGEELLFAGWESSWTETASTTLDTEEETQLFDQTIDYLIDDDYYTYFSDTEVLFSETDLEAFAGYLEEV